MSGITVSRYRVESAAERDVREKRVEWERFVRASGEYAALRAEAAAYRKAFGAAVIEIPAAPGVRSGASSSRIAAASDTIVALTNQYRAELRASVATAAHQNVIDTVPHGVVQQADTDRSTIVRPLETGQAATAHRRRAEAAATRAAPASRAAASQPAAQTGGDPLSPVDADKLRQLAGKATVEFGKLPGDTDPDLREQCRQVVAQIATATSTMTAQLALTSLTRRVAREVRHADTVRSVSIELLALAGRVEELPGAEAAALRQAVTALVDQQIVEVPAGLAERVDRLVTDHDRARRRKTVAYALRQSLTDLDYDVSEGFETALASDGVAYASLPGRPGYGVRVTFDAEREAVRTDVVRAQRLHTPRSDDIAAEKAFCGDYQPLVGRLSRRGVSLTEVGLKLPGEVALSLVADEALPAGRTVTQGRRASQQKERTV